MSDPKQDLKRRFQNLSDDELLELIEVKSHEYTDEALSVAKEVAKERGGIQKIKQEIENKLPPEIEEPSIEEFEGDFSDDDDFIEKEKNEKKKTSKIKSKVVIKKRNKIERVILSGGIIGMLGTSPRRALAKKIEEVNSEGWTIRQVIDDNTGNLLIYILRFILLFLTLFLWTPANGYFLILEKDEN